MKTILQSINKLFIHDSWFLLGIRAQRCRAGKRLINSIIQLFYQILLYLRNEIGI